MGKGFKITMIVLLSLIAVLLTGILVALLINSKNFDFTFSFSDNTSSNIVEEVTIENIKDLDLDFDVADVNIESSEDNLIKVTIYSDNAKEHSVTEEESYIKVVYKEKNSFHLFGKSSKIVITLPKDYDSKLSIKGDVGDIDVDNFINMKLVVDANVGDVDIKDVDNIKIKLDTGDLTIREVNDLNAEVNAGNITVKKITNSVIAEVDMGNITIKDLNILVDSSLKVDAGNVTVNKINDIYVDAKTDLGKVVVNGDNRRSEITLTVNNDLGNIKVG